MLHYTTLKNTQNLSLETKLKILDDHTPKRKAKFTI